MAGRTFTLSRVYGLLRCAAVVFLGTALGERKKVMAMSWLTVPDSELTTLACVISSRHCTFDILSKPLEGVANIPTVELAAKVVGRGNTSGRDTDTFKTFALAAAAASCVRPPLIDGCYASIECKVVDDRRVDASELFILEGRKAWIAPSTI
jgi:flavin reductase (DIM6/NTAB) family NADH-FMN oxidoreductase RutF